MKDGITFTRAAFRQLLESFLKLGYSVCGFEAVCPKAAHLILRHDIDFSPADALELGRIEADLGVHGIYFFLVASPFYSLDDPNTKAVYEALLGMGHEIGLHFDASPYSNHARVLDHEVDRECNLLEARTGKPTQVISFHKPAKSLLGRTELVAGRLHTYQPKFFSRIGYCSDSRGFWQYGMPLEQEAVQQRRAIQLLTHPIWWANDDAGDRERALARFSSSKGYDFKRAIADIVTGYNPVSGKIHNQD
jgi:hypothetical protein